MTDKFQTYEHSCGCVMVVNGVGNGFRVVTKASPPGAHWLMKNLCRRASRLVPDSVELRTHVCWVEDGWMDSQRETKANAAVQ